MAVIPGRQQAQAWPWGGSEVRGAVGDVQAQLYCCHLCTLG